MPEVRPWIAVVDDNASNRYTVTRYLKLAGFETREGASGREALALARESPGVLILDVQLPDGLGFDFCRQIKSDPQTNHVPVVHTSATFVTGDAQVEGLEGGADAYLTAPFEYPVLVSTIKALLRMRDAEAKSREAQATLSQQLADMKQLHEATLSVTREKDLNVTLDRVLTAAVKALGADKGVISLQAEGLAMLVLAASHGFSEEARHGMAFVSPGVGACGAAYQRREHVIVEDALSNPLMKDCQPAVKLGGFVSAHSAPLIGRDLRVIGVMTVHYTKTHRADEREMRLLDLYAQMAADVVERALTAAESARQEVTVRELAGTVESQAKLFDATLSNLTDLTYAFGPDCRFLYANRPLLKMLGRPLEAVVGKSLYELDYPKEQAERLEAQIRHVFETGETVRDETVIKLGPGKEEYHEYIYNPVRDANGKVVAMAGSTRIATDRRKLERRALFLSELSDQLGQLSSAAEIISAASREVGQQLDVDRCYFCSWHADMRHLTIENDWHRPDLHSIAGVLDSQDFGLERVSSDMDAARRVVNDVDADARWQRSLENYRAMGVRAFAASRVTRQDTGAVSLAVAMQAPREWAEDEISLIENVVARVWPMVERTRAIQAMRDSEQRYRELVQSLPVAVYTCDAHGHIQLYNEAAVKLWGRAPVMGQVERWCGSQMMFNPKGLQVRLDESPMAIALRENRSLREEMVIQRPSGQLRYVIVNPQPIRDSSGRATGAVNVIVDITERKREEQRTSFLHELSQKLSPLTDAGEIIRVSTAALGGRLRAHRCYFIEAHEGKDHIAISENWQRNPVDTPSLAGTYKLSQFGDAEWWRVYSAGNFRVEDVSLHPLTRDRAESYLALGVVSYLVQPFYHQGNWQTLLGVTDDHPRAWTDDELMLVEDVVARVWPMVQRARAMEALKQSEHDLRFALDAARLGSWEWEIGTGVLRSSERCKANFGLTPAQDFIDGDYTKSIFKEDIGSVEKAIDEALASRQVYETEYRVIWPDGSLHWILERGQAVYDEAGRALRVVGVNLDITERKVAEQALRETAERLELALEAAQLGIWSWDSRTDRVHLSPRMAGIMDIADTTGVHLRTDLRNTLHEDDRARARQANEYAMRNHVDYDEEYRLVRRDGGITWIASKGRGVYDAQGRPIGMLGVVQDITARKNSEEALRAKEQQLSLVAGTAPVLLTQCDHEERYTFVNRAYLEKRGLRHEQVMGKRMNEVLDSASYAAVKPYIDRVLSGEKVSFEVELMYRNELRTMEAFYVPEIDAHGKVKGWVAAVSDITERKRVHDAVRQLAAIVESSQDAIISRTLDGTIMSWNKGAEALFGYAAVEMLGESVMKLIPPERHSEETTIITRIRKGESVEHYQTKRVRRDGTQVDISLTVSPIRDEHGRVTGASKIARDITQQKRYEAELEAAQIQLQAHAQNLEQKVEERTTLLREAVTQMEEFSYTVSHDLRAPLRAMNSYSQALLEDYAPQLDATAKDYLNRIQRSSQRMEQLTHDVLMYSRLVRSEVVLAEIDLEDMVRDVIDQYEDLQAPKADVEIRSPLGFAVGHEVTLGQCLANLLTNAVKFVAKGTKPKVTIYSEKRGDRIRLWIQDNGIGIAPEHHAKIFMIFERLHGREQYEGTGMGLAIVRKAMEKMGGACGVESTLNQGSRFWLELPAKTG